MTSAVPQRSDRTVQVRDGESRPADSRRPEPFRATREADRAARDRVDQRSIAPQFLVPRGWMHVAVWMVGILLFGGAMLRTIPPLATVNLALAAVGIVTASRYFAAIERARPRSYAQRFFVMIVAVALPMAFVGAGLSLWSVPAGPNGFPVLLGLLVVLSAASLVILHGRLATAAAAQVALWTGVEVIIGSIGLIIVLAMSVGGVAVFARDRMRRDARAAEDRLVVLRDQRRAEEILSEYEQTGQGWFWETDRRGMIVYVSHTIERQLGAKRGSLAGRPFTDLFNLDDQVQTGERTLHFHLSARSSFQELAVRAATKDEDERWWSISGRPIHDHFDNFTGFRGAGSDLTEKRRSQEHASRLAHYDSLTGLANRFQMSETIEKILNAKRDDHRDCTVFLLDLDRFKQVNDTMGHPAGDALLKQVAQRLERTVGTAGRVGRLGGDEFQVILPGRIPRDDLAGLASRIIENLSQPYSIEGHRVVIGASVGIALAPDDGVTSEALIRNADLALYAAKDGGRGRHHFYAADLHSDAEERRQLEQDLRDAIANGGLELYYQPVVQTTTEKVTGFEALLRWTHPIHGAMSPAKFVPIAEDAGLIAQIGEWALRTACFDLARWPADVRVAVNVSPLQFANPSLPAIVTSALAAAQIAPNRLELEITESVFLNDDSSTEAMFAALKRVGVRLALDDFGTGYSSLGYLRKAPFDKIKIDQSFVRGATMEGSRHGAIISSIVSLAEALNMETTAEGVETLDELDLIRQLGCSHIQGYIYSMPLSSADATERLESGLSAVAHGPRSARPIRQTMLRKVVLEHGTEQYHGMIRNISTTGAMVEGLWNVPAGTIFSISLASGHVVTATTRWCKDDRMGIEFAKPLGLDASGGVNVLAPRGQDTEQNAVQLRRLG